MVCGGGGGEGGLGYDITPTTKSQNHSSVISSERQILISVHPIT